MKLLSVLRLETENFRHGQNVSFNGYESILNNRSCLVCLWRDFLILCKSSANGSYYSWPLVGKCCKVPLDWFHDVIIHGLDLLRYLVASLSEWTEDDVCQREVQPMLSDTKEYCHCDHHKQIRSLWPDYASRLQWYSSLQTKLQGISVHTSSIDISISGCSANNQDNDDVQQWSAWNQRKVSSSKQGLVVTQQNDDYDYQAANDIHPPPHGFGCLSWVVSKCREWEQLKFCWRRRAILFIIIFLG